MKPHQDEPENRCDLYILRTKGIKLKSRKLPLNGFRHHLVWKRRGVSFPVNESAAQVWSCCHKFICAADLVQALTSLYPESTALESEVLAAGDGDALQGEFFKLA